ncbi:MAG: hypothetical protein LBP25_06415 [Tannerellaceae bacterium]|nr:hypothetical protein [Tannerellaceae bacterium]
MQQKSGRRGACSGGIGRQDLFKGIRPGESENLGGRLQENRAGRPLSGALILLESNATRCFIPRPDILPLIRCMP